MDNFYALTFLLTCTALSACNSGPSNESAVNEQIDSATANLDSPVDSNSNTPINSNPLSAAVTALKVNGDAGNYTFDVTLRSPDIGCNQYADWWEVISMDGTLLYRRILTHSHVDEQPFTRSGGPVAIDADETIIIRAHMNTLGYGHTVFSGSVSQGFTMSTLDASFAQTQEFAQPLPQNCAF